MEVYASSTVRRRNTVIKRPRRKQIRGPYFSDFFSVSYNYGYNCSYKKICQICFNNSPSRLILAQGLLIDLGSWLEAGGAQSSFATDVRLPMNIRTTRLVYLVSFMLQVANTSYKITAARFPLQIFQIICIQISKSAPGQ